MQIEVNSLNINYETFGEGNSVVLLYGWLTDMETVRLLANSLSKNFKVYLIDVVGF